MIILICFGFPNVIFCASYLLNPTRRTHHVTKASMWEIRRQPHCLLGLQLRQQQINNIPACMGPMYCDGHFTCSMCILLHRVLQEKTLLQGNTTQIQKGNFKYFLSKSWSGHGSMHLYSQHLGDWDKRIAASLSLSYRQFKASLNYIIETLYQKFK